MTDNIQAGPRHRLIAMQQRVAETRSWFERTLLGQVWRRMLDIEFVDRSVALAGKAFVSFFPLVIVVAAFMPDAIRTSILTSITNRLGFAATRSKRRATRSHRQTTFAGRPGSSDSC
jgi:hypothetical protein